MLKTSLAASAGWLLSSQLQARQRASTGSRVVIVGAGFAGLAAAHELHTAGYQVVVCEARNRVGGRVLTFTDLVRNKTMEGGGELIGANHPAWLAYRTKFKLGLLEIPEEAFDVPIALEGRVLSNAEARDIWEEIEPAVATLNAEARSLEDPFEPWCSPSARVWDERPLSAWIAELRVSERCRRVIDAQFAGDNGVRTAWQSHLANLAMIGGGGVERYWTDTELFRCRGGNQSLARALASTLPASRLRLRTIVDRIDVRQPTCRVVLADGTQLECDDVVLTCPPSVWNRVAFEPALPSGLLPQMGSNVKYLMALKAPFWRQLRRASTSFSDGPVTWTWNGTEGQAGPGAGMVAFSGAADAEQCRTWTARERDERYLLALSPIYPGIRQAFVASRFMDWPGDAWSKASYSFSAPGQVTSQGPALRDGIEGRLHFAGEYACYAFPGYMEGALSSAVRLASRLATRDGLARANP